MRVRQRLLNTDIDSVLHFITHANGCRGGRVVIALVCLFSTKYLIIRWNENHQILRTNVARRVLKTHLFWGQKVKRSKVKVTSHSAGVGLCTPVSAAYSSLCFIFERYTRI